MAAVYSFMKRRIKLSNKREAGEAPSPSLSSNHVLHILECRLLGCPQRYHCMIAQLDSCGIIGPSQWAEWDGEETEKGYIATQFLVEMKTSKKRKVRIRLAEHHCKQRKITGTSTGSFTGSFCCSETMKTGWVKNNLKRDFHFKTIILQTEIIISLTSHIWAWVK
jgi:hypothetical protein